MGKTVTYTATLERFSGINAVLVNVHHKGKFFSDHVWMRCSKKLESFSEGDKLRFTATAYTYKDTNGERKHGLTKAHNYDIDDGFIETLIHDKKHSTRRRQ